MTVGKSSWTPVGVSLENAALNTVYSGRNTMVIAGPGAGKTELLAQRASFLLETGDCTPPRKILAISFKADAAKNLEDRVKLRCGKELSRRFESRTYDSFAKNILDHFRAGLEENYRPQKDYEVLTAWESVRQMASRNMEVPDQSNRFWKTFTDKRLASQRLPISNNDGLTVALERDMWNVMVRGTSYTNAGLTFQMISRLAEYLLRTNPLITQALRMTYSHIFLDEFQDTTTIQYDLFLTAFLGSDAIITAVGDDKQRIMGWAGALDNAFQTFSQDFGAEEIRLIMNHRSAPKLVEIQNIIAKNLDSTAAIVLPSNKWNDLEGVCEVWAFSRYEKEAEYLAKQLHNWISQENLAPRDICIVVKQSEAIYAKVIMDEIQKQGMHSRIEKEFQDLLTEEATEIYLSIMTLANSLRAGEERQKLFDLYLVLQGIDEELKLGSIYEADEKFEDFLSLFRERLFSVSDVEDFEVLLRTVISFYGEKPFKTRFPKYTRGEWLNYVTINTANKLWDAYQQAGGWIQAIDTFRGVYSIPIMTIHKSKGLEYDSVIFVGVEDKAFWNFSNQREEDKKAFFVAMSRAKKRMIFTFSRYREIQDFGELQVRQQTNTQISELYKVLQQAGVEVVTPEKFS